MDIFAVDEIVLRNAIESSNERKETIPTELVAVIRKEIEEDEYGQPSFTF